MTVAQQLCRCGHTRRAHVVYGNARCNACEGAAAHHKFAYAHRDLIDYTVGRKGEVVRRWIYQGRACRSVLERCPRDGLLGERSTYDGKGGRRVAAYTHRATVVRGGPLPHLSVASGDHCTVEITNRTPDAVAV